MPTIAQQEGRARRQPMPIPDSTSLILSMPSFLGARLIFLKHQMILRMRARKLTGRPGRHGGKPLRESIPAIKKQEGQPYGARPSCPSLINLTLLELIRKTNTS